MKKIIALIIFFLFNLNISTLAIELPKYYKFPKNYLKGKFQDSTKNFFIVATEKLNDSRFKDAVIVMLEHDKNGALGITINKPIGVVNIGTIIKSLNDKEFDENIFYDLEVPIYWGGPLDKNKILIIHSKDYNNENTKNYNNISVTNDHKVLIDIAKNKGPKKSLIVIGVSAWNIGQLEGEIDGGHWNLSEVSDKILFEKNNEKKYILAIKNSFIRL